MKRIISLLLSVVLTVGLLTVGIVPASAASAFEPSEDMIELLKTLEGFDRYPRWDYSQWTVGYGCACPAEDLERYRADGITEEEAEALLKEQLSTFVKSVNSFIDKYDLNYTQNQFDALVLFTYNMGSGWMFRTGSFRDNLIAGIDGNELLFSMGQWSHAGGEVLTQLVRRRLMEYNMFCNGVYSRSVPENLCYVLYEFNGGDGKTDVQAYDTEDEIRVIPTKTGYEFAGWYTMNVGGVKVEKLDASVRNMTLYARWTKSGETPADPEEPGQEEPETMDPLRITVTGDYVNVRSGPGTNYAVVDQVNSGDTMTITEVKTGSGYTWGKFDKGWIALMYTNYEDLMAVQPEEPPVTEPTEPPVTEPTEPPVTEPTEPPVTEPPVEEPEEPETPVVMGTVTVDYLRIRSGAGTSYEVLGFVHTGTRVEILEIKTVGAMDWGRMEEGWISLTYVKLDEVPEEPPVEEPQEPPVTEPTEPEDPPVTEPTEPPVTEPPVTEPEEPEEPKEPEVTTRMGTVRVDDFLRIRNGPGTSYGMVGYLKDGARVEILEERTVGGMTWGRIEKGWICLDYVQMDVIEVQPEQPPVTEPEVPEEPDTRIMTVTADCLRIRSGAGLSNTIVGFLYWGDKVEVLDTKTVDGMTWAKISQGWVSMDYLA